MFRPNCLLDLIEREGIEAHHAFLARVVRRHRGNLVAIGWDLNVSHRTVRRHVLWAGLWGEVAAARALPPRAGSDLLARALEKL